MALVLKDRVKETTTTTGTGTLTLLGASTGYQSFTAIGDGNTCYYAISTTGNNQWEVGVGTYTASGATLSRDTILESSTGGGAIDLDAGTKEVYVVYPAEKGVWLDASGNLVQNQFTGMNVTGTATINVATLTSGTITTGANSATDIVNKAYVDNAVAAGVHFHEPVRVESPINLNATYDNGTDGVGATLTNAGTQAALVIDGVTMVVADRVLIYEQTNQTQNGVYVVTSIGSGATNWVLTRSDDANTYEVASPEGLSEGSTFFVQEGVTGVGETYTCNTVGAITFGTTNITFAQVSSAQIYSAGTGLNLSGTTFSLANTTVTPATYGTSGQVAQIAINAQGQITSASNVGIAITASNVSGLAPSATTDTTNASNITTGTLLNARTTAAASNGASTIVARDASGNFSAAGITATSFSGDGANLTALNGTAITTGTVANTRTTAASANGASTIVARDASGNFAANVITATTFSGAASGNGSALTNLNASAITTGTLDNARTSAASANGASSIVARDASGNFAANTITATLTGTASNATVLQNARTIALQDGATGTATSFNGSANISIPVTALNASVLSAGTVPTARISGAYTGITQVGTLTAGVWNASAISDVYLSTISTAGKVSNSATTATNSNGANSIVARDASGNFSANVITANGSALTNLNGTAITTGTVANARTTASSANGASTIVARDASGNFTGATITATAFSGSGASLTSLNASNIASGTVPTARLASGTANNTSYLRGDQTWQVIIPTPVVITPTNISPASGTTNVFPGQVLQASGFFALYGYTFANAQWQVSTSAVFATTVFDSGTSGAAVTSITTSAGYITTNTTYYWRVRYKASDGTFSEYSPAFSFTTAAAFTYTIDYVVVAGGGGGAAGRFNGTSGGGGGAGGLRIGNQTVTGGGAQSFALTVGAGGNPGTNGGECCGENGAQGSSTSGFSLSCTGGGFGSGPNSAAAGSGGSGGGGVFSNFSPWSGSGGSGTGGEGNSGASGGAGTAGGGGGKNGSGGNPTGGSGYTWLNGLIYAAGGPGAISGVGPAGTDGRGNGGGGGVGGSAGGKGGNGVVIVRYSGTQKGSGGTVTNAGGFTYHTFTSSGTFTS